MARVEELSGYRVGSRREKRQAPTGEVIEVLVLAFLSRDGEHTVQMALTDDGVESVERALRPSRIKVVAPQGMPTGSPVPII